MKLMISEMVPEGNSCGYIVKFPEELFDSYLDAIRILMMGSPYEISGPYISHDNMVYLGVLYSSDDYDGLKVKKFITEAFGFN